jgi:prepilin-type processing-associated H-X9-DG protein
MKELGAARAKEYKGNSNIVMVDGHTIGYFGERKVGSTWSARDNRVLHAHTENWVNLPGNAPLFSFETPFNNGLVSTLESVLTQTKEALKTDNLIAIFDRGGSSALGFEILTEKGFGIITYQKGEYDDIDINKFKAGDIKLGVRNYSFHPYEQEIELKIYEEIDKGEYKKPRRTYTKRTIKMRDIRIICEDGHQISILANKHVKLSSEGVADVIFQRIGSQENIFKYMRQHSLIYT